jgi:hypothetical protein
LVLLIRSDVRAARRAAAVATPGEEKEFS